MAESELYKKGIALRSALLGEEFTTRMNQSTYENPTMQTFREVTAETVFGALWTRPGLDLKTRTLICVVSDAATGRDPELTVPLPHGHAAGVDGRGTHRGVAASLRLCGGAAHS